jgi:hypothetical protein
MKTILKLPSNAKLKLIDFKGKYVKWIPRNDFKIINPLKAPMLNGNFQMEIVSLAQLFPRIPF